MVNFFMPKRKLPRKLIHTDVIINDSIRGLAFDISEKGMYIHNSESKFTFKVKDIIDVTFDLGSNAIDAKAVVQHVDHGFGIGVSFKDMPPQTSSTLKEFLNSPHPGLIDKDRKTVLLVVPDAQPRFSYKMSLLLEGFYVLEAASGQDTLAHLRLKRPDIMVMDMHAGGLSAVKILQFMRTRKDLQDVPAIILSAAFRPEDVKQLVALGASNCLNKTTTNPIILCKKVKDILTG
jgi:CheY-like chemotaxis protein